MIPILYEANETEFITLGIGPLADAIKCVVTEELNGEYELEMTYPVSGIHYPELAEDKLIYAVPFEGGRKQIFKIYEIEKPLNGEVTVRAEHIHYLLNKMVVKPFTATSAAEAMSKIKPNIIDVCPFTFTTDKTLQAAFKMVVPIECGKLLGGTEGSILDVYGPGDYEFDNFEVKLLAHRGANNGVTVRYGKNMTELDASVDTTNVYTGIIPYYKDSEDNVTYATGYAVWSDHKSDYAYPMAKVVDMSSYFDSEREAWEEAHQDDDEEYAPTSAELATKARVYLEKNAGWDKNTNIKVSFINLWQSDEYANLAVLERVKMGDTVTVINQQLGVRTTKKVIKTEYNVLLGRYDSIELGTPTVSMTSEIVNTSNAIQKATTDTQSMMDKAIDHATKLITGGLGGNVVINTNASGNPNEILIMDTASKETAVNVWRFNLNGLGHSHSGYNGPFNDVALTQDGKINATMITTGTLNANRIQAGILTDKLSSNFWNLDTGEFRLSSGTYFGDKTFQSYVEDLQDQIDGNVTTWFYAYAPTTSNAPASTWTTVNDKIAHIGDLFYNSNTGYCYRYQVKTTAVDPAHPTANEFEWVQISDEDIAAAMQAANTAQDTADHKRRIFTTQPTTPYDVGDTWMVGANGDILTCTTARSEGNYSANDWQKLNKYTDDSALTTFLSGAYTDDKINLQNQIDGKAETWYQDTDPSTAWTTAATKAKHEGDLWYKTLNNENTTWFYKKSGNTYSWVQQDVPKEVFDEIDGKAQIFISTPTIPYYVGDLWCEGASGDILSCVHERLTGSYTATDWVKKNKYTDDSTFTAFRDGTYATFVRNTNNALDGKITTYYQTSAPTTNVTGDLWIDTDDGNKLYRWNGTNWVSVQDAGIQSALTAAGTAQTTADGKIVTFAQGTAPTATDIGDLWIDTSNNNKLYRWDGSAWIAYTDTSALNNWIANTYTDDKDNLQTQIDGKAETWYQASNPATAWTTIAKKDAHVGDLWYKTSDHTTWYYQKSGSTYSWEQQNVPDAVFDQIDGKAQIFISQPTIPYYAGDLWFNSSSSDIMTCIRTRETGSYTASDWEKRNKYIDTSAATSAANSAVSDYDTTLDQQKVFNKLTNNGDASGIFMEEGELYINADYLVSGMITDKQNNSYWDLDEGVLHLGANTLIGDDKTIATSFDINTVAGLVSSEVTRATAAENSIFANYVGTAIPTNDNYPAQNWTTSAVIKSHEADTYYRKLNEYGTEGEYYRWVVEEVTT